jgi:glycosyltransferase involved in cell wall biosynthesis
MKILQVSIYGELKFGGPPQKIFALSDGLGNAGNQVDIATFHSEFPRGKPAEKQGNFTIHYLSWKGKGLWQIPTDVKRLRELISKADIVHCYGLYNLLCPLAAFQAQKMQCPYLLEPLGMYTPRTQSLRGKVLYHRLFTSRMARRAARVIATSPQEMEELSGLTDNDKLVLRRNGLNLSAFNELPLSSQFRSQFGINESERIILYIGRISPIKNLEVLVRAFQRADLSKARLVLVGPQLEPEYSKQLRSLIEKFDLSERVLFTGALFDEDKLAALAAADLFVLPSVYESYGNAAAEAVAANVPVLLTEGCGIAPQIHKRAGLAVAPEESALAEGMRIFLQDVYRRDSLTANRAAVIEDLSWAQPLQQTEKLYRTIRKESKNAHSGN